MRNLSHLTASLLLVTAAALTGACGGGASGADPDAGATDAAAGPDASTEVGCSPYATRAAQPELFIGPDGLQTRLLSEIDSATTSLSVMLYLVTVDNFVDAFIDAHRRGVDVELLLDLDHNGNISARSDLEAAGVPLRDVPDTFTHGHTKAMLIDGDRAIIMSSNLNVTSMQDERNYGVIDRDPEDVADLAAIFASDWADDGSYPDLGCTRLIVSPVNARSRILQHINRAEQTLDLAVMYIADDSVETAVIQQHRAGVDVRVLLADPQWIDSNVDTIAAFEAAGVPVRIASGIDMHAKLVVADGIPFVGSQNMSFTSLNENREVGVIVTAETPAAAARGQFDADWSAGVAP